MAEVCFDYLDGNGVAFILYFVGMKGHVRPDLKRILQLCIVTLLIFTLTRNNTMLPTLIKRMEGVDVSREKRLYRSIKCGKYVQLFDCED
jgi:hypothetical protein